MQTRQSQKHRHKFGGRKCKPYTGHSKEGRQQECKENNSNKSAHDRSSKGTFDRFHSTEGRRSDNIDAGKEETKEVQAQSFFGIDSQCCVMFPVEYRSNLWCTQINKGNKYSRKTKGSHEGHAKDLMYFLFLSGSVRFADQWLRALCNSVKECHRDQRGICNHTVGGDADITGK